MQGGTVLAFAEEKLFPFSYFSFFGFVFYFGLFLFFAFVCLSSLLLSFS